MHRLLGQLLTIALLAQAALGGAAAPSRAPSRRTEYGCEGSTLSVTCPRNTVIRTIRANFGRFSANICTSRREETSGTSLSTNCIQPTTLRKVKQSCDGRSSCSLTVSTAQFGDPCPGTSKYIEVHYTCQEASRDAAAAAGAWTPVNSPMPPWLLDLSATPLPRMTTKETTTTSPPPVPITSPELVEEAVEAVDDGFVVTKHEFPAGQQEFGEEDIEFLDELAHHCPPTAMRGLFWNWTAIGTEAIQVCPIGATGFARWRCGADAQWTTDTPNLLECQSMWLNRLESRLHNFAGSVEVIVDELASMTEAKSLYGGDISIVNNVIQGLAHKLRQDLYALGDQHEKEQRVNYLVEKVMKVASNLLDRTQLLAWRDLSAEKRASLATSLILGVEENTLLLTETINNEKHLVKRASNLLTSIKVLRSKYAMDQEFSETPGESFLLSSEGLQETSVNGAARVAFIKLDNMEQILPGMGTFFVNSKMVHTVVPEYQRRRLRHPLQITLRHLRFHKMRNPVCASWDMVHKRWANQDCLVLNSNATHTVCECHKLSNYAILMEDNPNAQPQNADGGFSLSVEAQWGILASLVAVVIVVVVLLSVLIARVLRRKRTQYGSLSSLFRTKCDFYSSTSTPASPNTVYTDVPSHSTTVYTIRDDYEQHAAATAAVTPKHSSVAGPQRPTSAHIYHEILEPYFYHSHSGSDATTVSSEMSSPAVPAVITLQDGDRLVRVNNPYGFTVHQLQRHQEHQQQILLQQQQSQQVYQC